MLGVRRAPSETVALIKRTYLTSLVLGIAASAWSRHLFAVVLPPWRQLLVFDACTAVLTALVFVALERTRGRKMVNRLAVVLGLYSVFSGLWFPAVRTALSSVASVLFASATSTTPQTAEWSEWYAGLVLVYGHGCVYLYHCAYAFPWVHSRPLRVAFFHAGFVCHAAGMLFGAALPVLLLLQPVTNGMAVVNGAGGSVVLACAAWCQGKFGGRFGYTERRFVDMRSQTRTGAIARDADGADGALQRLPDSASATRADAVDPARTFTVFQITDPHIGLLVTADRLREVCRRAVELDPDFILLTGDLLAVECLRDQLTHQRLEYALAPLAARVSSGRGGVVACLGNHDYDMLDMTRAIFTKFSIKLLEDARTTLRTANGLNVDFVGGHFAFSDIKPQTFNLCKRFPSLQTDAGGSADSDSEAARASSARVAGAEKIDASVMLIHDPRAFEALPLDRHALMFAGHFHGGIVGLLSLGVSWTICWDVFGAPDRGVWRSGSNLMYLHRGTGQSSFPIRLGISRETSVVEVAV